MNIELYFEITISGISKDLIVKKINRMGYQFLPYGITEYGKKDIEPNQFMCVSIISEKGAFNQLVGKISSLYQLDGIAKVKILHTPKVERKWSDHFLIPLLITGVINILYGLSIIWGLPTDTPLNLDFITYVKILLVPAVLSFLSTGLIMHFQPRD